VDYPLENLGPERFQQLCQALLARDNPTLQCFPVAQPDGGRDAALVLFESDQSKFVVYQVKFSRKPMAETDPHKWLLAIIESEAPKVKALIPKGATSFFLLTNVPGTSHADRGSIDKLNKVLAQSMEIPAMCWWRDDINRRLDTAWSLKWLYPELMTGPDFLRAVIESGLTEHRERRAAAVRAFLRHQFDTDEEVRFKQVELQNKLLDLFIDVPLALRDSPHSRRQYYTYRRAAQALVSLPIETNEAGLLIDDHYMRNEVLPGAASFLLSEDVQSHMQNVVLEGAPGQGKSTITQYVCQIHRMKLLREEQLTLATPAPHRSAPVRLPIKIDLRDFATWVTRKNPFILEDEQEPPGWRKSLEAFLAALISHQSGGTDFSTDDLLAVAKISSILLVCDGLDEVADIATRKQVVDEIVRGVQRLQANAASLQTIVTSRPAAFANSPGMPERKYISTYIFIWSRYPNH
jgi:hypothetical protein